MSEKGYTILGGGGGGGAVVLFIFSNVEHPVLNNQAPKTENKSSRLTINTTSKIDYE